MKRARPVVLAHVLLLLAAGAPPALPGQTAVVAVEEENFRAEPGGSIVAELLEGTRLELGGRDGRWREAALEAWIWAPSVREQRAGETDLVVNAGGENLRAEPNGRRLGRALGGMRLERLESDGRWHRVRRTAWIWAPSIRVLAEPTVAPTGSPGGDDGSEEPSPGPSRGQGAVTEGRVPAEVAAAGGTLVILDAPAGDTLARLGEGSEVEVLAREGDWARVRVEGWTFAGSLVAPDSGAGGILADLPRDSVLARPDRYRGRLVAWTLQFIALQEAERFRTDFLEGEPFILARGPGDDPGFVYVAVPTELLGAAERLDPLQRIRVVGRIRSPRSSLTGAPVLELIEIRGR